MIIATMTHHVRAGLLDVALRRIGENTDQMARQPGFVFRHAGSPAGQPLTVVTVTGWESEADMANWEASSRPTAGADAGASVYERLERSVITVTDERWAKSVGWRVATAS